MEETYSLKKILSLILDKIWMIVTIVFLGAILAFYISKFVLPLKYSSYISMYVQSYKEINGDDDGKYNDIGKSKQLINTYIEVLKDDAVMESVGAALQQKFDEATIAKSFDMLDGAIRPSSLRSELSITSVTDTSALKIVATSQNAELSAEICNELSRQAGKYIDQAIGVGSVSTIDTAKVYKSPISPNTSKNTFLGAAAGLLLSLFIVFLKDFFDNTIKDVNTLADTYNKPIVGEIRKFGNEKTAKKQNEKHVKLTDKNVPFHIIESYKTMRTNIAFSLSTFEKKIIAVSSSSPDDGKSTISSNIAIAVAQKGDRVLLIDADMRKPVQHKIFGVKNKNGLSSAISKMCELDECIQKSIIDNLDIMTAGPIPPNPSELLSSEEAKEIFEKLNLAYDMVIVDLPPICMVSDALTLSHDVAGLLLVVRYGKTTFDDIAEANKRLELAEMNILGYVVNDINTKERANYYANNKYKDYNYGYSQRKVKHED